ncbi:MAG: PDZ domain-containing protein [Actinobacteria bacterium]|nr:PDZ domain-containing protein [Actinomycetota bacterium]
MKRLLTPARLTIAGLALLLLVAVVLWLVPSNSYLLLPDTARSVAPLVTVGKPGAKADDDNGEIFFLAVLVRKANMLERLFPSIRSGATLIPASALRPPGVSEGTQRRIDQRDMTESQSIAAAVALRAMGYKVIARQNGAQIADVVPGTPAVGKLKPTDVIVSVDGNRVRTPDDLRRLIRMHRPGEIVSLGVRDAKGLRTVDIRTKSEGGHPVIGVIIDQSANIRLPFPIKIRAGSVVGPSAGLAFALEIMEKLGRDVDHGYRIAATGELQLSGAVLPIGGVEQKAIEAKQSHVDILLIPAGDNATQARRYAGNVRVIAVQSFQQVLRDLATLPEKR